MLIIAGGVLVELTRFWRAIRPPKVTWESAQAAILIAAFGAAALAYSASRIASPSSAFTPGLMQLLRPLGGAGLVWVREPAEYPESPKVERKVVQSAAEQRFVF